MNNFFIRIQGFDVHGSKHEAQFTMSGEKLDGEKLCEEYANKNSFTDVSIVYSRDLGSVKEPDVALTPTKKPRTKK